MHQSTAVRKKWFVSNYLSSWNFSKMYCPQPRPGWFKWKHFNKPVWQLLAKTLNRKQVNAKTLWFIYIKILVCHLHIFIVIYSFNFVKMISSGCFFRFCFYTLCFCLQRGWIQSCCPLMHILYIQFVQFAFNNHVRFQVREEGEK